MMGVLLVPVTIVVAFIIAWLISKRKELIPWETVGGAFLLVFAGLVYFGGVSTISQNRFGYDVLPTYAMLAWVFLILGIGSLVGALLAYSKKKVGYIVAIIFSFLAVILPFLIDEFSIVLEGNSASLFAICLFSGFIFCAFGSAKGCERPAK